MHASNTAPRHCTLWLAIGPAGCGKTTLGAALAALLDAPFLDADTFHSGANIAKMRSGVALDDEDRAPWLARFGAALHAELTRASELVAACSALKRSYRDAIRRAAGEAHLILLCQDVAPEELARRLTARRDHFFSPSLLASQLRDFEPPQPDETAVLVPAGFDPAAAARFCAAAASNL